MAKATKLAERFGQMPRASRGAVRRHPPVDSNADTISRSMGGNTDAAATALAFHAWRRK